MRDVASHCDARLEQLAVISLIFRCDSHLNWLQTLEARGGLKVGALLAAVQRRSAFGTLLEVEPFRHEGRAVVASRSGYGLHHARKSRAGDVQRWPGALRPWAILSFKGTVIGMRTVGVVIAPLPVLAVAFHRMLVGSLLCCQTVLGFAGFNRCGRKLCETRVQADGELYKCLDTRENV
jgi:hypothetical protein